jgi:alpha-galactosidase/6-phospho-beta-glucosidase family protein
MTGGRPRVVFVGGGSVQWMPVLIRDFLSVDALADAEYVLLDIDGPATLPIVELATQMARRLDCGATFTPTVDRAAALAGADYVVITISTGGLDAMEADLAVPADYGIRHTVGDTCGPAGWSRFIRNFGVFAELAADINTYSRGAFVLNYTNPLATLTKVLADTCTGPVIGLCHGVQENEDFIRHLYGSGPADRVSLRFGGLNHFFWTTAARVDGTDAIAGLSERVQNESLEDMWPEGMPDLFGFTSGRKVATELFRQTGCLPYLADRHTCEFVPWYITDAATMECYGLQRTTIEQRRASLVDGRQWIAGMLRDGLPESFLAPSRETAARIVRAHLTGEPFATVGNVPNIGQVSNLPQGVVVETMTVIDQNGVTPMVFGPLPEPVRALVEPWAQLYQLWVRACVEGDRDLAMTALRLDPLCAALSSTDVAELGGRLLDAHKGHIACFDGGGIT